MYRISKFVNWSELWEELEASVDESLFDEDSEIISKILQFTNDKNVEILHDECFIEDGVIHIFFSESGGQNESDNQGWSRDYCLIFNLDFELIDITYEQG